LNLICNAISNKVQGLDISQLEEQLRGRIVTFKYPKQCALLNWNGKTRHASKVEIEVEVIN